MKTARLSNVPIKDLLTILNRLAVHYEMVDVIVNLEEKGIILDPVERTFDDTELTDENIYTLV